MLEQLLRKWAQKGFWQSFPSRFGPATSEACNANDLIKCMCKQGLIFNSLCKWWTHPCQEHWPNGLRRSRNRSRIGSQRLFLGCQTWLPWLLWGIWLQAGKTMRVTWQGMMISQDKDPSCIHLYCKPAGLCNWCKLEEDWLHGLIWPQCSKPDLSTDHYSLKKAFWSFWHMYNSYSKASPPTPLLSLPYRLLFKRVQPEHCNFFIWKRFLKFVLFFTLWKNFEVYHIQSIGSSLFFSNFPSTTFVNYPPFEQGSSPALILPWNHDAIFVFLTSKSFPWSPTVMS